MEKKTKILIVDDDPKLRKTLSDILAVKGYAPVTVAKGQTALNKVEKEAPAVALIDLKLEDISGLEVMKGIKELSPNTECIIITGYASQETAIESVNMGAYSYVQKPYDIDQLFVTVQRAVEKLESEEALKESENRFRSLFENMLEGIAYCEMLFDERGTPIDFIYLEVNEAFEQLTGLGDVVGKKVTEVIPGIRETSPELFEIYGRVALTGMAESIEINFKPLNQWLTISVYSSQKGYFVAVFDNITDREQAEEQLRESEEKWRTLFETSRDVVSISTVEGRYIDINPAGEKLFGYTRDEFLELDISKDIYINPDERKKFQKKIEEEEFVKDYEITFKKKDDTPIDCLLTATVWRDSVGNILGYHGIIRDMTEWKKMEEQLIQTEKLSSLGGDHLRCGPRVQ